MASSLRTSTWFTIGELARRTGVATSALRFYQRRGWILAAVHLGAVEASRRTKPSIPRRGHDGIPIRDELELECALPPFGDLAPDEHDA